MCCTTVGASAFTAQAQSAQTLQVQSAQTLQTIAWLAGSYKGTIQRAAQNAADAPTVTELEEYWTPLAGGMMLGVGRTIRNGKTTEYEFLRIEINNGQITYTANPSGQKEASFQLVRSSSTEAVFENPQHDYPQRIRYTRRTDGGITATTELMNGSKSREFVFFRSEVNKHSNE